MSLLIRVLILAAVLFVVFTWGFLITQAQGQDMFPALKDGDLCVVFRTAAMNLTGQTLAQDDVIAYQYQGKRYFGRVIAAAGDVVNLGSSGSVTVNDVTMGGEILFPTFLSGDLTYPVTVPEGQVFVLGDYRTHAADSRVQGPIPLSDVEGRVITILRRREL